MKKPTQPNQAAGKSGKFFRGVWAELKKVHWPTRSELITYTLVVFVSVAIVSFLIWIVDSALTAALTKILA
ncbi:MAG TPA: preprotein translocase subunit SecE [Candidatus Deferrimicrobium sp.]|nr:preprotein translocase subunit SecE [Candidatus Deferrimicrobium sp.]